MALYRLTNVSIAFIYREATYRSETISQTHLGELLEVLDETEDWVKVCQQDNYTGWVAKGAIASKPSNWDKYNYFYPAQQVCWIYQSPDIHSATIRDMTLLSGLPILTRVDGWVQVMLPDGQQGWVVDQPRYLVKSPDIETLIQTAFSFQGLQYVWAGRSPKGFDCSGFTQTVFDLNGFQLPRDAWQQAQVGSQVADAYQSWKPGDLVFFAERPGEITHVAISLGQGDIIHASGYVKVNSLNPDHADIFIGKYAQIFIKTMRVLP